MEWLTGSLTDFTDPMTLPFGVVVLRLLTAVVLGGLIGWEREVQSRAAGLRTHMLISLAAACFTLTALELSEFAAAGEGGVESDPFTLIEAVTSGVAFLAAGSIVISGGSVRGVTTGASMWLCGAIGLCSGTGDLQLALLVTGMALAVLYLIRLFVAPAAQAMRKDEDKDGIADDEEDEPPQLNN